MIVFQSNFTITASDINCHPDRSLPFPKGMASGVEGPWVSVGVNGSRYPSHFLLSIGGGIGQSRTLMLLLRKAHPGEVSVTVWPKMLKEMCAKKNIFVLE